MMQVENLRAGYGRIQVLHGVSLRIEAGACAVQPAGRARVFRPDLTEEQPIPLGLCAGGATVTLIPVETLLEAQN